MEGMGIDTKDGTAFVVVVAEVASLSIVSITCFGE
jgi:hypothetical protein